MIDSNATVPRPVGGETYQQIKGYDGNPIILTYNDLWMMIVCQQTMDGDWIRIREAATMVADASHKHEIAERLWQLEQELGGLPEIPGPIAKLHLQRAHVWFNQRPVSTGKSW